MSNTIKDSKGRSLFTNIMGNDVIIGQYAIPFSELLPVIEHYLRGGFFGHVRADLRTKSKCLDKFTKYFHMLKLTRDNEESILRFIRNVRRLNPYLITTVDGENLSFLTKTEAKGFSGNTQYKIRPLREKKNVGPVK